MNAPSSAVLPPPRRAPAEWPTYLAAFALALALHAAWWFGSARPWHPDLSPRAAPFRARVAFVAPPAAHPDAAWQEDVRGLWSPVLFALPTSVGFSPSVVHRDLRQRQALRSAGGDAVLLAQAAGVAQPLPAYGRSLQETVAAASNRLAFAIEEPVFPVAGQTTGFALRVQWLDAAPALQGGGLNARDLAPWLDDHPWEATAFLSFDAQGMARSVFLETPTASRERNEAIVRALRRLHTAPGGVPVVARAQLQYDQSALPAPAGGSRP